MTLAEDAQFLPEFVPYLRASDAYRRAMVADLANTVGGGNCGPMAAGFVRSAAQQEAMACFFMERAMATGNAGLAKTASSMMNDAKQSKLAAYEICAKQASRKKGAVNEALLQAQADFQKLLLAEQKKTQKLKAKPVIDVVADEAPVEPVVEDGVEG